MPPPTPPLPSPPPLPPPPASGPRLNEGNVQGGFNAFSPIGASVAATASINASTQGILSGLQSVANRAYNVGANIGESILRGILSGPLGRSGQALSSIGGNVIGAAQGVAGAGLKIGLGAVGAGAQVAGAAATLPLNLASAAFGGVGSVLGAAGAAIPGAGALLAAGGGLLSGIGGIIGKISTGLTTLFNQFLNGVTGLVSTVGDALGKIGEAGGAVFNSLLDIFSDVVETAKQVSRQVRSLSLNAGISQAQSGRVLNAFSFAGGNTSALTDAYSQPLGAVSIGVRARLLGLPDPTQDPEGFLLGNAAKRQSMRGPVGQAIYGALAGPQLQGIAGDSAGLSQAQLQRNFALARSFELPKGTVELGSDATAVSAAFSALGTNLKLVLGSVLVPLLPKLNQAFSALIQNKDAIVGAITTVGSYLVNDLPKLILHMGSGLLRTTGVVFGAVGDFLTNTFQQWGVSLLQHLPAILSGIDSFVKGLASLAGISAGLAASIVQAAQNFSQTTVGKMLFPGAGATAGTTTGAATGSATGAATGATNANAQGPTPTSAANPTGATAQTPVNPWGMSIVPGGSTGIAPSATGPNGTSTYSQNVPYSPNNTTNAYGGARARWAAAAAGAAAGAWGGAKVGGAAAGVVGGALTAVAGGIIGAGAGGVGAIPGAIAGYALGASTFAPVGAIVGGIIGAAKGGYAAYQAARFAQNTAQGTFNPQAAQAAGVLPPGTLTITPTNGAQAGTNAGQTANGGAPTNPFVPQPNRTPGQAFAAGQAWAQGLGVSANLSQYQTQIHDTITSILSGAKDAGNWLSDNKDRPGALADKLDAMADNWNVGDKLDAIKNAVEQGNKSQNDMSRQLMMALLGQTARASALIAEDYGAAILRS